MAKRWLLLTLMINYVSAASALHAATFTLQPVADAFVSSANPTSNYGGAGAEAVSAPGLAKGEFQSLLLFNLATAKSSFDATFGAGDWTVQSASLQFTDAAPNNGIFNATAAGSFDIGWMQNGTWTEGSGTPNLPGGTGITWNTLPSFLSAGDQSFGTFSYDGSTTETTVYNLGLPTGFLADVASGKTNSSMRLFAGDTTISGLFDSRSFGTSGSRPMLSLTAVATVPEPASWLLGVCGINALALLRRRLNDGSGGPRGRG